MEIDFTMVPGDGMPFSLYGRLREAGPVIWSDSLEGWIVSSYDAIRMVLSDVSRFTMEGTPVASAFGPEAMLVNDTPMHHVMRAVWTKQVSRDALIARSSELEAIAAQVMAGVRPRLEAGETVDLIPVIQDFLLAFVAVSFGIPEHRMPVYEHWAKVHADAPAVSRADDTPEQKAHVAGREAVFDVIREAVADRRARLDRGERCEDLVASMAGAVGRQGITERMAVDNLFNFSTGALGTTEKWIGNIVKTIFTRPELRNEIDADRNATGLVIDEIMRVEAVAQAVMRRVRPQGTELEGKWLNGGDQVYAMLGAANRDPLQFDDPDTFNFRRPVKPSLGFGFGFHHCLGINIARQEAIAFTNMLLDGYRDLRILDSDFGSSWALWGPRTLHVAAFGPAAN